MKKLLTLLTFAAMGASALCLNMSCSVTTPTAADNFQSPVKTIAFINTPYTSTPTNTATSTPTITFTPTNTGTPTPYEANAAWTGFSTPQAIAAFNSASNGGVFIADTGHNQVAKYNFSGSPIAAWGNNGKGKGRIDFNKPLAVAVDASGDLYVVGGVPGVVKYDNNGNYLTQFNSVSFTNPQGIGLDPSGNIYVSDTAHDRIVKLNSGGSLVGGFGSGGALTILGANAVTNAIPYGLAVDNNGNVAVGASDNNIHIYDPNGNPLTTIPFVNNQAFNNPQGVAFDTGNNLYVADTGYHQVEEFSNSALNGSPIVIFNNGGSLVSPTGVAVDFNGNIYVADSAASKVIQFVP